MLEKDISDNRSIGEFGAKAILSSVMDGEQVRILTHCNTGSLATAYFGTALGVVRCLHSASRLGKIFVNGLLACKIQMYQLKNLLLIFQKIVISPKPGRTIKAPG